jgi:hypothetical protein
MYNKTIAFIFSIIITVGSLAYGQKTYPQNYFTFPIKPGQINTLSGNMGEIRPNHFHAGLDIRTEQRVGLPVYAAADGYVYRIKVSTVGYGNVIYVKHPNGYVTVYAHLLKFGPEVADYVRTHQYNQESFEIELYPAKGEFPVKQKQVIAYSGNSGGSGGPHLHFEIRDSMETILNPLLFGFKEIKDNVPPVLKKVALTTLDIHSRIDGEFGKKIYTPVKRKGTNLYSIPSPIEVNGLVGLEIDTYDLLNGTSFKEGVNCVEVKLDGKEIYYHKLDRLAYTEIGHINIHKDYDAFKTHGHKFQRCYIADGNKLDVYRTNAQKGRIYITDDKLHKLDVVIWDVHKNKITLELELQGTPPPLPVVLSKNSAGPVTIQHKVYENVLKIAARDLSEGTARLYSKGSSLPLPLAYTTNNEHVYLWDLRKGLPDSIAIDGNIQSYNFKKAVPSQQQVTFKNEEVSLNFGEEILFDTLYLEYKLEDGIYNIHNYTVPLQNYMECSIKLPARSADVSRMNVYLENPGGRSYRFVGGEWVGNEVRFKTKMLGRFYIAEDKVAPSIKLSSVNQNQVKFYIRDNQSGIESFRATINGQWLLMSYDYKLNMIWSEKLDDKMPLKGELVLEVKDNAGNISTFQKTLP